MILLRLIAKFRNSKSTIDFNPTMILLRPCPMISPTSQYPYFNPTMILLRLPNPNPAKIPAPKFQSHYDLIKTITIDLDVPFEKRFQSHYDLIKTKENE